MPKTKEATEAPRPKTEAEILEDLASAKAAAEAVVEKKGLEAKRELLGRYEEQLAEINAVTPRNIIPKDERVELKEVLVGAAQAEEDKALARYAVSTAGWSVGDWAAECSRSMPPTLVPAATKALKEIDYFLPRIGKLIEAIAVERHRLHVQATTPQRLHLETEIAGLRADLGVK